MNMKKKKTRRKEKKMNKTVQLTEKLSCTFYISVYQDKRT